MPKIVLSGQIVVSQNDLAAVRAALPEHIRLTRLEPGCLTFAVSEDPQQPGRFHVHETFVDRAAFDAHQRRAQQSDWAAVSQHAVRQYQVDEVAD